MARAPVVGAATALRALFDYMITLHERNLLNGGNQIMNELNSLPKKLKIEFCQ